MADFHFFNFLPLTVFLLQNEFQMEHAKKVEEVRSVLKEVGEDTLKALLMIDAVQRLGIDYHFHGEIEAVLERLYTKFNMSDCHNDLYELALGFRLLRQEGYYVSAGRFSLLFFSFFFSRKSDFPLLNHLL